MPRTASCAECDQALGQPLHSLFRSDCDQCHVRMLARGPLFHAALRANKLTPAYRKALEDNFGGDDIAGWHRRVRDEAERVAAAGRVAA